MSRKLPVATPDRIAAITQQTRDLSMLSVLMIGTSRAALRGGQVNTDTYAMAMEWVGDEIERRVAAIEEMLS
ncbi:hypothetical protein [Gluconacetobacter diazotrophicus]|uniref:Uncharacterized protein n=1 Tax=Gluconacetobacter diazotrophicus (strain ATCC 49037 / DSM 5601 / CCUG 37298 / CIP 103539 / LMG 7603 / PAl5) TaxID=272568 RepID=A9H6R9_GLUDA|nr:hypothetical protein [Gluconacetobacter diazotrophicus]CAP57538.1 hypothetical protein GDI3595 [Gluconacetobacter diazotrophicus PA1 5]